MDRNFNKMILRQPAMRWQDALPAGNGMMGALVYGHIQNEVMVLNHENLWLRSKKPALKPVSQYLDELRRLLLAGKYRQAAELFSRVQREANPEVKVDPYQPAFDLGIGMETRKAFKHYRRSLDLETGEVTVQWEEEGNLFRRRLFVSRADDVVVLHITSSGNTPFSCSFSFFPHDAEAMTSLGAGRDIPARELPFTYDVAARDNKLVFEAAHKDGTRFGGVARVEARGGSVTGKAAAVLVDNAAEVTVAIKLFVSQEVVSQNDRSMMERFGSELEALNCDYAYLLGRHIALHGELFGRMRLELGTEGEMPSSNEELLMAAYEGEAPHELLQKMFHYGRYLLISSSRPGGLPANLQGIWNGDYTPAWWCDFHNDENIQMNYWQALPGNLPEVTLPYFDYYESMLEDFRANAQAIYGCRGILVPVCQTTHGLIWPDVWAAWTAGAGWLAQLFYDYWLFTGDREFLKSRIIPFLKEIALFYEDFLVERDGQLLFIPSLSPENEPSCNNSSLLTINATMDIAVAREVLSNLCSACRLLGLEQENISRWQDILDRLQAYEINKDGALKEWLYPGLEDNYHHRHLSHLYPLFPGTEVTEESNMELYQAMKTAVEKRLVIGLTSQTGWSLAHMANIYARLGDGNRALECLELVCRSCVGVNLFTYHNDWRSQGITMFWGHRNHPPFQIDANLGIAAAILEMLVFSTPGLIKLLPALPDRWEKGRAKGILCRGGMAVTVEWDKGAGSLNAGFKSFIDQEVVVKFPEVPRTIRCSHDQAVSLDREDRMNYRRIRLHREVPLTIHVTF